MVDEWYDERLCVCVCMYESMCARACARNFDCSSLDGSYCEREGSVCVQISSH